MSRRGIQVRAQVLVVAGVLAPIAILGWLAWKSLSDLTDQVFAERQALARSTAERIDEMLRQDLESLYAASASPIAESNELGNVTLQGLLRSGFLRSRLLSGVFLLDANGDVRWEDPAAAEGNPVRAPDPGVVRETLQSGKPVLSGLIASSDGRRQLYLLLPLKDYQGKTVGMAGGLLDPGRPAFRALLQTQLKGTGSRDLVDSDGVVIASSDPSRVLVDSDHREFLKGLIQDRRPATGTCHGCHEGRAMPERVKEVMAFAPLSLFPWGVIIRQPEAEAFASIARLKKQTLMLAPPLLGVALLFAWGAAQSVRRPLAVLTVAAERIASGELSRPIPKLPSDEIGRLGRSLETMRVALVKSLDDIQKTNERLEERVVARTRDLAALTLELKDRDERRAWLLRKFISAQEDERKRIARELHDETCQTVTALVMGLETARTSATPEIASERYDAVLALAQRTLDGLHRLIFDLRPSVLDDLGLLSAIRWYVSRHLEPIGIAVRCEFEGLDDRLPVEIETAVFRVVQEALTNIVRHSGAETVLIQVAARDDALSVEIEDDGKGFDLAGVSKPVLSGRGLGLQGIRERVEILGGTLQIESSPGDGTRIAFTVPLDLVPKAAA